MTTGIANGRTKISGKVFRAPQRLVRKKRSAHTIRRHCKKQYPSSAFLTGLRGDIDVAVLESF